MTTSTMARVTRSISVAQALFGLALAWLFLPALLAAPLALLLAIVAFMLALHLLLLLVGFALSAAAASPVPPSLRLGPLGWLRLFVNEYRASVASIMLRVPLFGARPLASAQVPIRAPVLLVHGYFCNRAVWRPLARHLARNGHPVGSVNLEPAFGSIDAYADPIDREVRALQARNGGQRVTLICHSMGGLAARAYLRRHGTASVAQVITIGTPHGGTALATAFGAPNVRQMRVASDWLRALSAAETEAVGKLFTVIRSVHDNIVAPTAIQGVAGATTIEVGGVGHLRMILDPDIWRRIDALLDRPDA